MPKRIYFLFVSLVLLSCINFEKKDRAKCLSCNLFLDNPKFKQYDVVYKPTQKNTKPILIVSNIEKLYWNKCAVITLKKGLYSVFKVENNQIFKSEFFNYKELEVYFKQNISKDHDLRLDNCEGLYSLLVPRVVCQ